jgi:hypothetical protein
MNHAINNCVRNNGGETIRVLPDEQLHEAMGADRGYDARQIAGFRSVWTNKTDDAPTMAPDCAEGLIRAHADNGVDRQTGLSLAMNPTTGPTGNGAGKPASQSLVHPSGETE